MIERFTKDKVVICDLDGVLCDDRHRRFYLTTYQFEEYHRRSDRDRPHEEMVNCLQTLAAYYKIVYVSGRPEDRREATTKWLETHLQPIPHELLLRPDFDARPSSALKLDLIHKYFGDLDVAKQRTAIAIDDDIRVVAAYREIGLRTWHVG